MNDFPIFIVNTIEKFERSALGCLETGDCRSVGFFRELSKAQEIVRYNYGDINETIYDYAVIEKMYPGLYRRSKKRWYFKFNYEKNEYESIEKPDHVSEYDLFSLG